MERKLELADIAGYLPYSLKVERYCMIDEYMETLNVVGCMTNISNMPPALWLRCTEGRGDFMEHICLCKPILHSMSDLTKPMTHPDINNGEEFVPIEYISFEILGNYTPNKWEVKKGRDTIDGEIVRQSIGIEYSDNLGGGQYAVCFSKGNTSVHIRNANGDMVDTRCTMMVIEFLQKTHFDYLGLIDQGLAIDINTIE